MAKGCRRVSGVTGDAAVASLRRSAELTLEVDQLAQSMSAAGAGTVPVDYQSINSQAEVLL